MANQNNRVVTATATTAETLGGPWRARPRDARTASQRKTRASTRNRKKVATATGTNKKGWSPGIFSMPMISRSEFCQ